MRSLRSLRLNNSHKLGKVPRVDLGSWIGFASARGASHTPSVKQKRSMVGRALAVSLAVTLATWLSPGTASAWGPHPAITQAALDALGARHPLFVLLGPQAQRLTNYCWMADYKRIPFREPDQDFYADDFLLFPQVTTHLDHICPEVKKTYRPYFE